MQQKLNQDGVETEAVMKVATKILLTPEVRGSYPTIGKVSNLPVSQWQRKESKEKWSGMACLQSKDPMLVTPINFRDQVHNENTVLKRFIMISSCKC